MEVYKFNLVRKSGELKIIREIIEVEEKPKTYLYGRTRILKGEIGKVYDRYEIRIYLLEDDFNKAKSLFEEQLKMKIETQENMMEGVKKAIKSLKIELAKIHSLEGIEN